jgi:hypothetical protein
MGVISAKEQNAAKNAGTEVGLRSSERKLISIIPFIAQAIVSQCN